MAATREMNARGLEGPSLATVQPLSPTIGAEITGVDLRQPVSSATRAEIHRALLDWKVVFFRGQDISSEQHLAFARRFGDLEMFPFTPIAAPHPDHPEITLVHHGREIPGSENTWHNDVTWRRDPSLASVLRMTEVPTIGGDTLFADMEAAYDGLPDEIKSEIEGKVARHDFTLFRVALRMKGVGDDEIAKYDAEYPDPHHPIVRTHPETGRRSLFVNKTWTREIVGMDPLRSEQLLKLLYQQATFPEYQCRFRWEADSVAFWDNRSSQHYAVSDYWPHVRHGERVSILGDVPYFDPDQPVSGRSGESPIRGVIHGSIGEQVAAYRAECE